MLLLWTNGKWENSHTYRPSRFGKLFSMKCQFFWPKYLTIPCKRIQFQFIGKPEPTDSRHGLVFRAFLYLFQLLQERKDTNFVLKASFLEIYNEKVSQTSLG